jgi:4-carboxymuconolactone decarboxylase
MRCKATVRNETMTTSTAHSATLRTFDDETRALVRLAAVVTAGTEPQIRDALAGIAGAVPRAWIEELLLQTYLFAGFPRALNATREWRRVSGPLATSEVEVAGTRSEEAVRADGEATCRAVYGTMYEKLRHNVRELHPLLDEWMVVEGYGKVLSRQALDLCRRELCIVAACAAAGQERQLHSHLHGGLNVGVAPEVMDAAIAALEGVVAADRLTAARLLWLRVKGK